MALGRLAANSRTDPDGPDRRQAPFARAGDARNARPRNHREHGVLIFTGLVDDVPRGGTPSILPAPIVQPPAPAAAASHVVRITPRPELDVPATAVTKWTLTDPRFVTIHVPVGRTPRDALTIALAERGYQVVG